jgi:hypothetical protein
MFEKKAGAPGILVVFDRVKRADSWHSRVRRFVASTAALVVTDEGKNAEFGDSEDDFF